MKNFRKISFVTMLFCFLMVTTVWANEIDWANVPGHYNQSVLLDESETRASDSFHQYGRGEYLAEGSTEIVNYGNGQIYICVDTYAYVNVDAIYHSVFLEYWDEDENDWIQVGSWDFEKYKSETPNGQLYRLSTDFILTGYETGLYYRVRGLHGVEVYDEFEGCATETNGVLITDN